MGKKKKAKKKENITLGLDSNNPQSNKNKKEEPKYSCIVERRLEDRIIPKVDSGISETYITNPPPDIVEKWYQYAHVQKYVHLEQVTTSDGHTYTTKRVQFNFSQMLKGYGRNLNENGINPAIERLSYASVKKISFINNIANPLRYINYFIEYFDPDDELMRAYFHVMFQIMLEELDLDPQSFIETVYASFTTDSMIEKLVKMVEYNVDETLIKKADRVYDESIQLTVEHLKAIMGVSCLHKFIIPLVSHYYSTRTRLLEEANMTDKDLYYYVFTAILPVFDKAYDINLYNKLYHTSTTRVTKTVNQEARMWDRRRRVGTTPTSYTSNLMCDFVTDISQKGVFSKSAIIFIHVCMDRAIRNTLVQNDKYDFTEMSMEASDSVNERLSRWDRWQQDKSFHSQRDRIRAEVSIKEALDRLGLEFGLDFKRMRSNKQKNIDATKKAREEYAYYRDNIPKPLHDTQTYLIQAYYASRVGCAEHSKSIKFPDMIKLIMIMKRDFESRNYIYLPFFISGKVDVAAGKKYNKRRIEKLMMSHPLYDDLMDQFSDTEGFLNHDRICNDVKTVVACPVIVVDYKHNEMCGQLMKPVEVHAVDEMMRFMYSL